MLPKENLYLFISWTMADLQDTAQIELYGPWKTNLLFFHYLHMSLCNYIVRDSIIHSISTYIGKVNTVLCSIFRNGQSSPNLGRGCKVSCVGFTLGKGLASIWERGLQVLGQLSWELQLLLYSEPRERIYS